LFHTCLLFFFIKSKRAYTLGCYLIGRRFFFFSSSFLCLFKLVLDIFFLFINLTQIIIVICTHRIYRHRYIVFRRFLNWNENGDSRLQLAAAADNIIVYCLIDIFFSVQILCKRIRGKTLHNHFPYQNLYTHRIQVAQRPYYNLHIVCMYCCRV